MYLYIYLSPHNAVKQHTDPVTLQAVTWRHKLHVNQCRVCPEVVRYAISKTALQPFVNVICLIALYQYTDETRSLCRGPRRAFWTYLFLIHVSSHGRCSLFVAWCPVMRPPWRVKWRSTNLIQMQDLGLGFNPRPVHAFVCTKRTFDSDHPDSELKNLHPNLY